jgi:predicted kinase
MAGPKPRALLIILGGLPGAGKTTVARELARQLGATHLRIDSIEQALRTSEPPVQVLTDEGYRVAYAVAEDNLRLGNTVIADSVNPIAVTRDAWRSVATRTDSPFFEIEVVCSDREEHRRRVESRETDVAGLELPSWREVEEREYEVWPFASLVVDTAMLSAGEAASLIKARLDG